MIYGKRWNISEYTLFMNVTNDFSTIFFSIRYKTKRILENTLYVQRQLYNNFVKNTIRAMFD